MLLISFSVVTGIVLFGNESINVQNAVLTSLRSELQKAESKNTELQSQRQLLFQYYFTKAEINDSLIDDYVFANIRAFKLDRDLRGKSANNIVSDTKFNEHLIYDLGGPYYVGSSYESIEERTKKWNDNETAKYGEYFNKAFSDLRGISTKSNEHYDEKDPKWFEKGRVITIFEVVWNVDKLNKNTMADFMLDFNKLVTSSISKVEDEIARNAGLEQEIHAKIESETLRLEQPNIYVYGILVSKVIIVVFLLFLIQIFLSTFRYLIQTKGRYENQVLLLRYLGSKPKEKVEILALLVNEKVEMDRAPEPLLKDLFNRQGKN
jgi:hypothetical protein